MRRTPLGQGVGGLTSAHLAPMCATATAGGQRVPPLPPPRGRPPARLAQPASPGVPGGRCMCRRAHGRPRGLTFFGIRAHVGRSSDAS